MMFKHRIQNNQQFTHAGDKSYFFSFPDLTKTYVALTYNRIKPSSHQRRHIECRSNLRSTSPGAALTSPGPTVMVKRCYADESRYLPSVQVTQLRQVNKQSSRQVRAYTGYTLKQSIFFSLNRAFLDAPT